jgi:hypothetical protein
VAGASTAVAGLAAGADAASGLGTERMPADNDTAGAIVPGPFDPESDRTFWPALVQVLAPKTGAPASQDGAGGRGDEALGGLAGRLVPLPVVVPAPEAVVTEPEPAADDTGLSPEVLDGLVLTMDGAEAAFPWIRGLADLSPVE